MTTKRAPTTNRAPRFSHVKAEAKRTAFINAYFENGFNALRAALSIGIPPKSAQSQSSDFLINPVVMAEIEKRRQAISVKHNMTVDRLVDRLVPILEGNIEDYLIKLPGGDVLFNFDKVTRKQFAAVGEITTDTYTEGKGENMREVKRTKLKLHNPMEAVDKLARILGAYKDRGAAPGEAGNVYNITMNMPGISDTSGKAKEITAEVVSIVGER